MNELSDLLRDLIDYDPESGECNYDEEDVAECIKDYMEDSEEQSIENAQISDVVVVPNKDTDEVFVSVRMDAVVDDSKESIVVEKIIQF